MNIWLSLKIKDLGRVVTGKTPPTESKEMFDGSELFVSPRDLSWDQYYVDTTETRVSEKAFRQFKNQVLPANSVMFTSLSFAFGKMGITRKTSLTNQQINSIVVNENHDYRFIFYLLKAYKSIIFSYNSGIDTPIVPKSVFEGIEVTCPPKQVERKIAAILSAYDDLIANNQRRITLLERMAEDIYREWFVRLRFPGHEQAKMEKGLPKGWSALCFSEICTFIKGKNPAALFDDPRDDTLPYLNIETIEGAGISYASRAKNSVIATDDDVLMLMDGARSGIVFRGRAGIVSSTIALISTKPLMKYIMFEYLKAGKEAIVSNNTGSAIPHASKEFINRMTVFLPQDDKLIKQFNQIYKSIFQQSQNLNLQNKSLQLTRDALLPRLISGKLAVDVLDIRFPPSFEDTFAPK
jgi:type I restriction enzyme, S subunit